MKFCVFESMAFLRRLCSAAVSQPRMFSIEHTNTVSKKGHKKVPGLENMRMLYKNVWVDPNPSEKVWADVRSHFLKCSQVTPVCVDAKIMEMCIERKNNSAISSYYKFIKNNEYDLHVVIISKYFRSLLSRTEPLTIADKIDILHTYDLIRQKYQYLDYGTTDLCIQVLSLMGNYKEALRLMREYKTTHDFGVSSNNAIICAAFRAGDINLGLKLLSKLYNNMANPKESIYIAYLQYCVTQKETFAYNIEQMFQLWRKYSIIVSHNVIYEYIHSCKEMGQSAAYATIGQDNTCTHCKKKLSEEVLSSKECKELSKAILHKGLIDCDIYQTSTPEELKRFQYFVSKTKPYDIVIDGLNMYYTNFSMKIDAVVNYFLERGDTVLVLGRKHIERYPGFKQIKDKAYVYALNDMSNDDLFLLYATLVSGVNAKFISMDLMRQHKHKLQDRHLKDIFKRWQLTHQYMLKGQQGLSTIEPPNAVDPRAQKETDCWHIPFTKSTTLEDSYKYPKLWACIKS